jgi:hypothetical protein
MPRAVVVPVRDGVSDIGMRVPGEALHPFGKAVEVIDLEIIVHLEDAGAGRIGLEDLDQRVADLERQGLVVVGRVDGHERW